ncbi:MAG: transglutaminase domain-containing protein, partial [Nitrospirae bacterium]|nr:transglutaminase domain-containing protein [Nitrospirota bacterium]
MSYNRPPLLIGAALVLWGWSVDFLSAGILMGIILELPLVISFRVDTKDETFDQISSLVSIINMGFIVFILISKVFDERFIIVFIKWMPLTMLPVILGQYYSRQGSFPLDALFYTLRKRRKRQNIQSKNVDLTYVYLAAIAAAASAANLRTIWFYVSVTSLITYALYFKRSRRFNIAHWTMLIFLSAVMGYFGQIGLSALQGHLEELEISLLSGRYSSTDTQFSHTAIGRIKKLKLSGGIILRVEAKSPILLMDAAYNRYLNGQWFVSNSAWRGLNIDKRTSSFIVSNQNNPEDVNSLMVYGLNDEKIVVLPHPLGSNRIDNIAVRDVFINNLGTIKVDKDKGSETHKGFLSYKVDYTDIDDALVTKVDSFLTDKDKAATAGFINHYGLNTGMSQREIIERLGSIFKSDYRYSLKPEYAQIEDFLMKKKSGHCEYFATGTVLILRSLGIPSRYVTGFSVSERYKGLFIVRQRHAHAWARANINGRWIDIDTTPSIWAEEEAEDASIMEPMTDFFQGLNFRFQKWKAEGGIERNKWIIYGLFVIVMIYLLVRSKSLSLLRLRNKKTMKDDKSLSTMNPSPFI